MSNVEEPQEDDSIEAMVHPIEPQNGKISAPATRTLVESPKLFILITDFFFRFPRNTNT